MPGKVCCRSQLRVDHPFQTEWLHNALKVFDIGTEML